MTTTACTLTSSSYILLYLYGLVCVCFGFALGALFVSRSRHAGGYQPIDLGEVRSINPPPRKP